MEEIIRTLKEGIKICTKNEVKSIDDLTNITNKNEDAAKAALLLQYTIRKCEDGIYLGVGTEGINNMKRGYNTLLKKFPVLEYVRKEYIIS